MSGKPCCFNLLNGTSSVIHSLLHGSGSGRVASALASTAKCSWQAFYFKFLLLLRFLSFLKANMPFTMSYRKRSKLHCWCSRPPYHPRPTPPHSHTAACQPHGRLRTFTALCLHRIIQSCNAFLLLFSLLNFYHLSKPNSVQICHHYKHLPWSF